MGTQKDRSGYRAFGADDTRLRSCACEGCRTWERLCLPGAPVATVAAIDEVWLKGYVGEKDLGRVKLGQKAEITTDTFPGKIYPGVVTFISPRAEFTPKNVQTREERIKQVYKVKITILNREQELKIGMPAEGYIRTDVEPTSKVSGSPHDKTAP